MDAAQGRRRPIEIRSSPASGLLAASAGLGRLQGGCADREDRPPGLRRRNRPVRARAAISVRASSRSGRRDSGSCRYRATARRHVVTLVVRVGNSGPDTGRHNSVPAAAYGRRCRCTGSPSGRRCRWGPERTICRRRASPSSAPPLCVEHLSHLGPPRRLPHTSARESCHATGPVPSIRRPRRLRSPKR